MIIFTRIRKLVFVFNSQFASLFESPPIHAQPYSHPVWVPFLTVSGIVAVGLPEHEIVMATCEPHTATPLSLWMNEPALTSTQFHVQPLDLLHPVSKHAPPLLSNTGFGYTSCCITHTWGKNSPKTEGEIVWLLKGALSPFLLNFFYFLLYPKMLMEVVWLFPAKVSAKVLAKIVWPQGMFPPTNCSTVLNDIACHLLLADCQITPKRRHN